MARISTYKKDGNLNPNDRVLGSSYDGLVNGTHKYTTSSYTLEDLSEYFSGFVNVNGLAYDLAAMYADIQNNITSIASANISISALADETQALAQADINLQTSFTTSISEAISEVNVTLTSLSNADLALASSVTALETSFTTDLTAAVASINTELTALTTADAALATSITTLETTFNTDLSSAVSTINTSLTTLSSENLALAQSLTALETTVTNIPATIRQPEPPDVNAYPLGSIWVDTDDNNSLYILAEGTPNYWQATTSEALGDLILSTAQLQQDLFTLSTDTDALALKTDTLTAQFGTYDAGTNSFTFLATSDYFNQVKTYVDVDSAVASDLTTLTATVTTLDTDVNARIDTANTAIATETTARVNAITTLEASIQDEATARAAAITTVEDAIADETTARAAAITTLEAAIDDETTAREAAIAIVNQAVVDETTARSTADTTLNTAISIKPNVYRQAAAPAVTAPVGSVWYDTDDNNKTYILVAGTPNVWTLTDDARIGATVSSLATAQSSLNTLTTDLQSEAAKITKLQTQYTFDTNGDINGLADGTIVSNAVNDAYQNALSDANIATAASIQTLSATISKIYKQASAPTGTIPTNSIWYDTDDSDKSYVYDGANWIYTVDATRATTASVQVVSDAVGDVQGKLVASHAITVDAGGKIAGLKLLSNGTTSEIAFTADTFKIFNTASNVAPFTLDGSALKLNVPLNGVSGTFSGELVAATGTFTGALNVNSKFLVNSAGSVQIYGGDLVGNARFEILDDSGNSKYRLYGGGINLNSWTGTGALSGGKIFYGAVAEIYSGNGTTVTTDHSLVINVYGGSKKLITRSDNFQMYNSAGGDGVILTVNGSIRATGNITAFYSSDKRLKDNIKPIENALDKVNKIGGYEFDWNENQSDFEGHDIGVIAQEIQAIAPELVTQRPDGYLAVKYEKLVAILIQGMKEQQAQIQELKEKLDGITK